MSLPVVSDATFASEVLQSELPVFVKFSATWCGPCKAIAPVVESMAHDYAGEMKFVEVDIDTAPETANQQGVRSVPTMMIFRNGASIVRDLGAQSRTRIAEMIDTALEGGAA